MRLAGRVIWLLVLLIAVAVIGFRFSSGSPLQTDFMALLPDEEQNVWVRQANDRMKEQVTQRVIVLVKANDFEATVLEAKELVAQLTEFADLQHPGNEIEKTAKALFPYRAMLLSEEDRKALQAGQADTIKKRALAQIMSPFAGMEADLIRQDPYLLFPAFMSSLDTSKKKIQVKEGWLVADDYIVLLFKLKQQAFDKHYQTEFVQAFETFARSTEATVLSTGAVFYAQAGAEQAEREATFIGGISLAGIILLNLLVFRSIRPILLSLLAISSGLITGFGVCLLIFGQIHLMALVFGAGLIGIAVDYTFHYCCDGIGDTESTALKRTQNIARPLTLGVISSSLGFLIMASAPFPGLQQIAVFAASGLAMAYLSVMCIYPLLDKSMGISHLTNLWGIGRKGALTVGAAGLLLALSGVFSFSIDDDVRRLQDLPRDLKQQEDKIRQFSGMDNSIRALLVQGDDEEQVLQREESLRDALETLRKDNMISGYQAISLLVPSQKRQAENYALIEKTLLGEDLVSFQSMIGLNSGKAPYEKHTFSESEGVMDELRLGAGLHLVRINGVADSTVLQTLADQTEGVYLFDPAKSISQTLGKYRHRAVLLISVACVVILLFLSYKYGFRDGVRIVFVPVFAVAVTPFIGAILGESFTLFNAMALLLVLAIGLDYALFSFEAPSCKVSPVVLANGLSAASTILAFGLLSFSDLYAIHAFGVTILIGIAIAYAMAPLVAKKKEEK